MLGTKGRWLEIYLRSCKMGAKGGDGEYFFIVFCFGWAGRELEGITVSCREAGLEMGRCCFPGEVLKSEFLRVYGVSLLAGKSLGTRIWKRLKW